MDAQTRAYLTHLAAAGGYSTEPETGPDLFSISTVLGAVAEGYVEIKAGNWFDVFDAHILTNSGYEAIGQRKPEPRYMKAYRLVLNLASKHSINRRQP